VKITSLPYCGHNEGRQDLSSLKDYMPMEFPDPESFCDVVKARSYTKTVRINCIIRSIGLQRIARLDEYNGGKL